MRTLLLLAENPAAVEAVREALNPEVYRLVARTDLEEAEPFLAHGLADACIADLELTGVQGIWLIEKLRRKAPRCPIIILSGARQPEWEEEAYLQGATHVLTRPIRARMLATVLDRLFAAPATSPHPAPPPPPPPAPPETGEKIVCSEAARTLTVLRDISGILSHSLDAEAMLRQFLMLLREILSVNRAAIFLKEPVPSFGTATASAESRHLRAACSTGLSQALLQHFELSFDAGIGAHLLRMGRILRRSSEEARGDVETQKEFELLGAQVAVPILDREHLLGVAVFDGRITGEPLANSELELVFRLLEQLGLAIRNIWLHDQLASNHELLADILREVSSACVVVNRDLAILHANKTARRYFGTTERRSGDMEFGDLPPMLGTKVYQVLKTGSAITNLRYEPEDGPRRIFNITIVPFQRQQAGLPASALLMAEDLTQSEQLRRLEVEAANLRLVSDMGKSLVHAIGNALVPLSTHQQLLADKWKDAEFRASLNVALIESVKRIERLLGQAKSLTVDSVPVPETFSLATLVEAAYQEARKYQPGKAGQIKHEASDPEVKVTGNKSALTQALAEVMLNGLQANPDDPKIKVRSGAEPLSNGARQLLIDAEDNGPGFTTETAQKACEPFFTTRNVGLGLGLTVARRIVEAHQGKLEIVTPKSGHRGIVRISLPLKPGSKE